MGKCSKNNYRINKYHKDLKDAYHILKDLLNNKNFIKAAAQATNPNNFKKNLNKLLKFAQTYEEYRISLSSTNGRTYFDSAFPLTNHDGTNVKDYSGNNIDVSGDIEVQYANLIAYNIICKKSRVGKYGVGADVRWDETVKDIQYFVSMTIRKKYNPTAFVLRVSRKPSVIIGGGGIPIQVDQFAIVDNQPFIVIEGNVIPIGYENIVVIGDQRFAIVNGQKFLLPRTDENKIAL